MHKKTILWVNIFCETVMDAGASKEILKYYFPYHKAIHLNINQLNENRKIAVISRTDYAPVADIPITFS